jgi:hypothetical protein
LIFGSKLSLSDEIILEARTRGHKTMATVGEPLEQTYLDGPMRKAPMSFVVTLNCLDQYIDV